MRARGTCETREVRPRGRARRRSCIRVADQRHKKAIKALKASHASQSQVDLAEAEKNIDVLQVKLTFARAKFGMATGERDRKQSQLVGLQSEAAALKIKATTTKRPSSQVARMKRNLDSEKQINHELQAESKSSKPHKPWCCADRSHRRPIQAVHHEQKRHLRRQQATHSENGFKWLRHSLESAGNLHGAKPIHAEVKVIYTDPGSCAYKSVLCCVKPRSSGL